MAMHVVTNPDNCVNEYFKKMFTYLRAVGQIISYYPNYTQVLWEENTFEN